MLEATLASSPVFSADPFTDRLLSLLVGKSPANQSSLAVPAVAVVDPVEFPVDDSSDDLSNFRIPHDLALGAGGAKAKAATNLQVIRLVHTLERSRAPASEAQKRLLACYVGWGGLPQAFRRPDGSVANGWEAVVADLEAELSADELSSARHSTTDAHYTPRVVVEAIYAGLERLGFRGGAVLEPGAGVGHFIGLAPSDLSDAMRWTAIELDALSAGITRALYPVARTVEAALQDVSVPASNFDLAIGNPPFGSNTLNDRDNRDLAGFTLHNYFVAKSLRSVVPGGLVAMVVSHTLMDKPRSRERAWLAERAHLLGAIRLPSSTFHATAGTEVTTDILFLQKVRGDETPDASRWVGLGTVEDAAGGDALSINRYFADHPEQMLGQMVWGTGQFGLEPTLAPITGVDLSAQLRHAIARLPENVAVPASSQEQRASHPDMPAGTPIFGHYVAPDGTIWQRQPDVLDMRRASPVDVAGRSKERLTALIELRLDLRALLEAERSDGTTGTISARRQRLDAGYDAFVGRFGYLNSQSNITAFRDDADAFLVRALEVRYQRLGRDEAALRGIHVPKGRDMVELAEKAPIFRTRVMYPHRTPAPETAADALAVCLNQRGRVDVPLMAELLKKSVAEVVEELGGRLYQTPGGQWETADDYLSGNVKRKLIEVREAVAVDAKFARNVQALEAVQPADLSPADIYAPLGSPWVPEDVYADFASGNLGLHNASVHFVRGAQAFVLHASNDGHSRFGTSEMTARDIFDKALNRVAIIIYVPVGDGKYEVDHEASEAARQQGEAMQMEFADWVWHDPDRRERLSRIYNDTFNTDVLRAFDGSHLTLPGKVSDTIIQLRTHQINAVWRMICDGTVLLDHEVGSGKTITTIAAFMEMRRIGLLRKPMITVPNALVDQWAQEVVRLYPAANVLAVTEADFAKDRRKLMFARIATGDWDMVIVAHSQFSRIKVSPSYLETYLSDRVAELRKVSADLASAGGNRRTVKQFEKAADRLKERIKATLDGVQKDNGTATMEDMGIDAIAVDESQAFKALSFSTRKRGVAGLGNPEGSQRAEDLYLKVRYLQSTKDHAATYFLTATPISNSISEMHAVMRYLAHDALSERGILLFDLWANAFAEMAVSFELDSSGQGLKARTILKRFLNVPELMTIYHRFADSVTLNDLKRVHLESTGRPWPVPKMIGGAPQNVVVPPSDALLHYIEGSIIPRMQAICGELGARPDPRDDNALKVTNDARLSRTDVRLRVPGAQDDPCSKVNEASRRIFELYQHWDARQGTQLVFCDLSTPSAAMSRERTEYLALAATADTGDEAAQRKLDAMSPDTVLALSSAFSVYDDLRTKLLGMGMLPHQVAFIHDARTDIQRRQLFDKVNRGEVRVLIGSSSKMGAGMNVQRRLVGLHHLDTPWRPSDLTQREGRILRQGNMFYEEAPEAFAVALFRYATQRTYDSRMWQLQERKASIVDQLRQATPGMREVDDIVNQAASAASMKAEASGNPLLIEQVELQANIKRFAALERNFRSHRYDAEFRLRRIENDGGPDARLKVALERATMGEQYVADQPRDPFNVIVDGKSYDEFKEGSVALANAVADRLNTTWSGKLPRHFATYRGAELRLTESISDPVIRLSTHGLNTFASVNVPIGKEGQLSAAGLVARLDNAFRSVAEWRTDAESAYRRDVAKAADLRDMLDQPFRHAQELADAETRLKIVTTQLVSFTHRPKSVRVTSPASDAVADANDANESAAMREAA